MAKRKVAQAAHLQDHELETSEKQENGDKKDKKKVIMANIW
jgi:hypothetical protein